MNKYANNGFGCLKLFKIKYFVVSIPNVYEYNTIYFCPKENFAE